MGPGAILFPIFYLLCMALLGVVILACVPRFRVSGLNVLLFVVGGIVGHAATAVPIERMMYNPRGYLWGVPEGLALPVILAGVIGAGSGLVALRMKLNRTSQRHGNSQTKKIRN
jgi:hypothetical protein